MIFNATSDKVIECAMVKKVTILAISLNRVTTKSSANKNNKMIETENDVLDAERQKLPERCRAFANLRDRKRMSCHRPLKIAVKFLCRSNQFQNLDMI